MAGARKKKTTETAVVVQSTPMAPVIAQPKSLVLEGDPEAQLAYAQKAANALMKVVKPKVINGKDYLMFGAWQTLGRFFGSSVGIEWTTPLADEKGKLLGYEARAVVYQNGQIISSAEASCMTSEKRWGTAEEYAIKSMAQTRASAKALRNAFGWVAELAGYESTPAEEMDGVVFDRSPVGSRTKVTSTASAEQEYFNHAPADAEDYPPAPRTNTFGMGNGAPDEMICSDTGKKISKPEYDYSIKFYGLPLSRDAQKNHTKIR